MGRLLSAIAGIVAGTALALVFPTFSAVANPRPAVAGEVTESHQTMHGADDAAAPQPSGEERLRVAVERHDESPRDERWAAGTERALAATLGSLPDGSGEMRLVRVECRLETCIAIVWWPAHPLAEEDATVLLRTAYAPNCGVALSVPPPSLSDTVGREGEAYLATIFFDCTVAREELAL